MQPIEILRQFLEKDEVLRPMSTVVGFANLLGRSECLIRNLEKGRTKPSPKLARRVSEVTGVSEAWILGTVHSKGFIPHRDGSPLSVQTLRESIMSHAFMPKFESDETTPAVQSVTDRVFIESVLRIIEVEMIEYKLKPNPNVRDPTIVLLRWITKRATAKIIQSA